MRHGVLPIDVQGVVVPGRLDHVSLTVEAGTAMALIGANGAGKSSLLHALAGRLRVRRGHVHVFGERPRRREASQLRAYVPQRIDLPHHLRVGEVLGAAARARGAGRTEVGRQAERMGLEDLLGVRLGRLSGGVQQRVALAAGLMGAPPLWLLDEPASALDAGGLARLAAWVTAHVEAGGTVVTSAHRPEEVDAFARVACLLQEGRVRAVCDVRALFDLVDDATGAPIELRSEQRLRRVPSSLLRDVLTGDAPPEVQR